MLFELQRVMEAETEHDHGLLGYHRIRVLAIEPWRLQMPGPHADDRAVATIDCVYIVETEAGIGQICASDLWLDVEDGFYRLVKAE